MQVFTVFAIVPTGENWEINDSKEVEVFDDEITDDFVVGTFSSEALALQGTKDFLVSYLVGDENQLELIGQNAPIMACTIWLTTLDAGQGLGEFQGEITVRQNGQHCSFLEWKPKAEEQG